MDGKIVWIDLKIAKVQRSNPNDKEEPWRSCLLIAAWKRRPMLPVMAKKQCFLKASVDGVGGVWVTLDLGIMEWTPFIALIFWLAFPAVSFVVFGSYQFTTMLACIYSIYVGRNGREWAWRNKRWESIAQFNRIQWRWDIAGGITFSILLSIVFIRILTLVSKSVAGTP